MPAVVNGLFGGGGNLLAWGAAHLWVGSMLIAAGFGLGCTGVGLPEGAIGVVLGIHAIAAGLTLVWAGGKVNEWW
jgi:hypothetical protein